MTVTGPVGRNTAGRVRSSESGNAVQKALQALESRQGSGSGPLDFSTY